MIYERIDGDPRYFRYLEIKDDEAQFFANPNKG